MKRAIDIEPIIDRINNLKAEEEPLQKKQRLGEWMPPGWIKTWKLKLPWLKTKDGRRALGSNVVTRWIKHKDGRWTREGTERWRNPNHNLVIWREYNNDFKLTKRNTLSLDSEEVEEVQRRKVMMVYGKGKRMSAAKDRSLQRFTQEELLLFLYWNFDVDRVDYYIRDPNQKFDNVLGDFTVMDGIREDMMFVCMPMMFTPGGVTFYKTESPEAFCIPDKKKNCHDWRRASFDDIWDVGEDALLLYGNQEPYNLNHIKPAVPSVRRFNIMNTPKGKVVVPNVDLQTVLDQKAMKEDVGQLWMMWMYGEACLEKRLNVLACKVGVLNLYQEYFDMMWSLCQVASSIKDHRMFVVIDIFVKNYGYGTNPYFTLTKQSKQEVLARTCARYTAQHGFQEEVKKLVHGWLSADDPYDFIIRLQAPDGNDF